MNHILNKILKIRNKILFQKSTRDKNKTFK